MRKHFKLLGLSLLALTAVMAVSASAAQANWQLLLNGTAVNSLNLNLHLFEGKLLVPGLGLNINCKEGNGTVTAKAEGKTLSGEAKGKFTGCTDVNFAKTCKVMGVGDPDGTISAKGTGVGSMSGEKVLVSASSSEFANVQYLGEECPLTEIDGRVSGSITVEVLNPLTDLTLHAVDLVGQELFFGEEPATLDVPLPAGSLTDEDPTKTFAVHLINL